MGQDSVSVFERRGPRLSKIRLAFSYLVAQGGPVFGWRKVQYSLDENTLPDKNQNSRYQSCLQR